MTYTMGSLFAGIGGFDLGFERAGFKTSWQVEIDPYCQKVLAKNFPEAERFGDIRECGRHNLKPVDVICGGFPCQDISVAGQGKGITGERSGLWGHYRRIVSEVRPRFVLVENSPALASRGLGTVLGDLAEIGYDAEWDCIPAAAVGAPHLRDRIWILAYATSERFTEAVFAGCKSSGALSEGDYRDEAKRSEDWKLVALVPGVRDGAAADWWRSQSRVVRSANGVRNWMDRVRGCGNSVVPQIPEMIARRIKQALENK